jgi:hypothetical protein
MKPLFVVLFAAGMALGPTLASAQSAAGTANRPIHPDKGKGVITAVDNHNGLTHRARCIMLYERHHRHIARHVAEDHCS